ncbi:MAG: hypothetical protein ACW97Z_14815 [Candidatus Hodarchaeales archaeon]
MTFGVLQVELSQVVLIESNRSRIDFLLDSGCVTHPVQNCFPNSCLTNSVMVVVFTADLSSNLILDNLFNSILSAVN